MNELQEVQINGVTVDPSNFTIEEGSTIVTLPIDYLKTLNVDNYEISVVSNNKTAKGGFSVVQPELNEHGFYYNQPYFGHVNTFDDYVVFFLLENGLANINFVNTGYTETCTFTSNSNGIVANSTYGTLNLTSSEDCTKIFCTELNTTFEMSDMFVADKEYIYTRTAYGSTDCYIVSGVIDKTKPQHDVIKTGINGLPTLELVPFLFKDDVHLTNFVIPNSIVYISDSAFDGCINLTDITIPSSINSISKHAFNNCTSLESIIFPNTVTSIDALAFGNCINLTNIIFEGTIEQWNAISLCNVDGDYDWNYNVPAAYVQCSDGQVQL